MIEDEIKRLYAIAISYDNRKLSEANITAWWEQADRNRWTFDEAREAIHRHHAESTEFLMPAHITQLIRAQRQQPERYKPIDPGISGPPADQPRINALISELADRLAWPRTSRATDPALAVPCPHCHAVVDRPCTRLAVRGSRRGTQVRTQRSHPSRVDLANGTKP